MATVKEETATFGSVRGLAGVAPQPPMPRSDALRPTVGEGAAGGA